MSNKINLTFLNNCLEIQENGEKIVISSERFIDNFMSFVITNADCVQFDYFGFKIVKTTNTNISIRNLIYKDNISTNIKINDIFIKQKDVIIISPFTRVSEIISDRNNDNLHQFLKENDIFLANNLLEQFINKQLISLPNNVQNIINHNYSKCDLINYCEVKDDFIDEYNIIDVLEILKTFNNKYTIIFNDIIYLKYDLVYKYLQHFNFLYFINHKNNDYQIIQNWEDYLIEYK